jgi:16S rRNA (guanine966-N2)-methyltransferase
VSRIIAGSRGGQRIVMPTGDSARPTTDRVREALFSATAAWAGTAAAPVEMSLHGLAFCDLYSGSGAVGLEAASRGASRVLLIERDPRTAQLSRRNAEALGLARSSYRRSNSCCGSLRLSRSISSSLTHRMNSTPQPSAPS